MAQISAKIGEQTGRNRARLPPQRALEHVNHVVRGRGNHLRHGNPAAKFSAIDSSVNERLAILASAKHRPQGRNRATRFNHQRATQLGLPRLTATLPPTLALANAERCR
jgi:Group II intron, maturase-specific domain